jgi:hypothetical protein
MLEAMIQAQLIPAAQETLVAHQSALAAFERAYTAAEVAAGLEKLAGLQRRAVGLAREIEAQVIEYGRPAPLVNLLDVMRGGADQIARGFGLVATTLDQMRRRVLAGSWSIPEVSDVVRAQAQIGGLYFEQLDTLLDRLRVVGDQAMRYFDAAFARVEADPVWNEKLREAFGLDGKPRGVGIAELPDDVDG